MNPSILKKEKICGVLKSNKLLITHARRESKVALDRVEYLTWLYVNDFVDSLYKCHHRLPFVV